MKMITQYADDVKQIKSTIKDKTFRDRAMREKRAEIPLLIYFNGACFDLYFIYKKMLEDESFDGVRYHIFTTFKGTCLVLFRIFDTETSEYVFNTHDIC